MDQQPALRLFGEAPRVSDEAAEQLNIRKNTARAHLRSIFSKTNVTRQTSLVTLLLSSMSSLE